MTSLSIILLIALSLGLFIAAKIRFFFPLLNTTSHLKYQFSRVYISALPFIFFLTP